jgi:hypothetical protein
MRPPACVLVLVLVAAAGCNRAADAPPPQKQAPVAQVQVVDPLKGVFENKGEQKEAKKDPQSLLGRIKAKAVRTGRQNELRQIALYFSAAPTPPRTLDQFKNEFKVQANSLYQAITDGYYTINLKARQGSQDIVAYETEGDGSNLHYFARADGSVDAMPGDQLKAALGQK